MFQILIKLHIPTQIHLELGNDFVFGVKCAKNTLSCPT